MPSASLQSRIQAFEALSSSLHATVSTTPLLSAPTANNRTNPLESPISPSANTFHPIAPFLASPRGSRSPSPSTPTLTGQTPSIDLKDWVVEDGPVEWPSVFHHTPTTGIGKLNGIREPSKIPPSRKFTPTHGISNSQTPLINLQSFPKPRPPLPPRKPSSSTIDPVSAQRSVFAGSEADATLRPPDRSESLTVEHTYPPGTRKFGAGRAGHTSASSISSFHSVSLSSDSGNVEIHGPKISPQPPSYTLEADSSATDADTASIAESFENVSAPSAASPSTAIPFNWEQAVGYSRTSSKPAPPSLPNRSGIKIAPIAPPKSLVRSASTSSSSTTTSTKTRRPPPPPPPYQPRSRPSSSWASVLSTSASTSDRSSVLSNATATSRTSISTWGSAQLGGNVKSSPLLRPTPVPPTARLRYETLFDTAVRGRRQAEKEIQKTKHSVPPPHAKKGRQAAGWRGLSVDLIANSEDRPVLSSENELGQSDGEEGSSIGPEEKMSGQIAKYIWSASRLDRKKLRSIWNDCDPQGTGCIDRDAFVTGMWRIDEELRRTQLARRTSALTAASSQRIPHRPLPPPRSRGTAQLRV